MLTTDYNRCTSTPLALYNPLLYVLSNSRKILEMTAPIPRLAYLHIGFADSSCAQSVMHIEEEASFVLDLHESWPALLTSIIANPPQAVLIHLNSLRQGPGSIAEISTMLKTVLSIYVTDSWNHIGVVVDNAVDVEFVRELRKSNILNIVPGVEFLGQEESTKATVALLAGVPYVLNVVKPIEDLPRVVSFRSKEQEQWTASIQHRIKHNGEYHIEFCTNWGAFTDSITEPTDLILFHCKMLSANHLSAAEVINMILAVTHYTTGKPAKIAAVIDKDTPLERIKELRNTELCGIVPSSEQWGPSVGNAAVISILSTGSHWPKDIIASLPGNIVKPMVTNQSFRLTARQKQIVDLISTRGLSNKRIASTLHIAESTVKIHVSAVLKVYGVRTRTQLALVASK
jgi:DNA-binding NarL/FixJ family response regulator